MYSTTIVVVEDEPIIAMDIRQRLTRLGYRVSAIANSYETTLAAIKKDRPDLVLMDIQLQGKSDGIATAAQVREQFNLPVVFLTAHADAVTLEQATATQPYGYLVKPFDSHDLSTAVEVALSRHRSDIAIHKALYREQELNQLKSHFVEMVSHEFRNPLSSLQFALDLIEQPDSRVPQAKKQIYIRRAKASIQRMRQLLDDVLMAGEVEAGKLQYKPVPVEIEPFCLSLIEEFQAGLGLHHCIQFTVTGSLPADQRIYHLDENLLNSILSNLLSNAIKYSSQHTEIQFTLLCEPQSVTFRLRDQGIGIPQADQTNLFSPFHRAGNTDGIPGTGLGLSIVKQCVMAHGGSISVDSMVGVGSTFIVTLPSLETMPDETAGP